MRFTVVLIDDEPWALKGLKNIIDWELNDFSVVGEFDDSEKALEFIKQNPPDAAFVDIRMPFISGIDLMKDCRESGINTEFVIISGFREFSYAQKALDYGAFSYLVKPLNKDDMQNIITKLFKRLHESRQHMADKIKFSLFNKSIMLDHESYVELLMKQLSSRVHNIPLRIGIALLEDLSGKSECIIQLFDDLKDMIVKVGKNRYFFIVENNELPNYIIDAVNSKDEDINVGMSTVFCEISNIEEMLHEASMALRSRFITGKCGIYEYKTLDYKKAIPYIEKAKQAIYESDLKNVMSILSRFCEEASRNCMGIENVMFFFNQVVAALVYKYPSDSINEYVFRDYEHLCDSYVNIQSLSNDIYYLIKDLSGKKSDSDLDILEELNVQMVLDYINENFEKELYLDEMVQKFHFSKSHFCRLFKKLTKKTFTEYLISIRMSKACNLLKSTDRPISAISESVGYRDYFYFSRMFKKYIGVTPIKYRK